MSSPLAQPDLALSEQALATIAESQKNHVQAIAVMKWEMSKLKNVISVNNERAATLLK